MLKIHELFLTFFYSGKIKKAPGTFGSLTSLIFWLIITKWFFNQEIPLFIQNIFWASFLIIATIYAFFAIPAYTKQFDQIDHKSIVLDETVGQIIALQLTFLLIHKIYFLEIKLILFHLLFCFISFRFFDIKKPYFIGYADRIKNSFGVMLDDILCGFVTATIGSLIYFLY